MKVLFTMINEIKYYQNFLFFNNLIVYLKNNPFIIINYIFAKMKFLNLYNYSFFIFYNY